MNLTGEAALLLGVLAVYAYWRVGLARAPRRLLTLLASAFLAGHLFVMGFRNWMQPAVARGPSSHHAALVLRGRVRSGPVPAGEALAPEGSGLAAC
jgi:hypothetical protein